MCRYCPVEHHDMTKAFFESKCWCECHERTGSKPDDCIVSYSCPCPCHTSEETQQ